MNDNFINKISGLTKAYDNFEKFSALAKPAVVALAGIPNFDNYSNFESILKVTNSFNDNYIHNVLANKHYFEPVKPNPIIAAFTNVTDLISHSSQFIDATNVEEIYKRLNLTVDLSKPFIDISNFNWREKFPEFNYNNTNLYSDSIEITKFAKSVSIDENVSNINDGITTSLTLDSQSLETLNDEIIEIFIIANQIIENVLNNSVESIYESYDKFIERSSKILGYEYTKEFIKSFVYPIIVAYITIYYISKPQSEIEEIISSKEIPVKVKPISNSKDCFKIPEGREVEVIKRFKVFARINYNDSNGDKQVGYCKIVDLKE